MQVRYVSVSRTEKLLLLFKKYFVETLNGIVEKMF